MTTFITPWGRYRYKTAPQGYIASGDGYTRRYDEIVADIANKTKCVDDALLWADSIQESFHQAANWLDVCGRNGIVLNPEKFVFGADTVEFAGFEISPTDVRPSHRYVRAITDFPTPKNLTDVRSWFGLVNQVSYAFSMADRMQPFRNLLNPISVLSGLTSFKNSLMNRNMSLQMRLKRVLLSLTLTDPHVLRQTGLRLELDFGSYKSIALALPSNHFAVQLVGRSRLSAVGLPTQLKLAMPPLKVKLLRLLMLSRKQDTLSLVVRT